MKSTGRKDVNYEDIWGLFLLFTQFIHWGPELSLNLCLQYEDGGDFQLTFMNRGQDINAWNQQDKSNENKSFFVVSFRNWLLKLKTRQLRVQMLVLFGVSRNSQTLLLFVLFGYFRFLLQLLTKYGSKSLIN